jgi:NTP pyrophosphatase (non-canonical NTP hydrolase)
MSRLHLSEIVFKNASRARRWHKGFPHDSTWTGADWSNAMCGEAGEAANVVKKLRRNEDSLAGNTEEKEELLQMLGEELADVICYLSLLAYYYNIDLEDALIAKFDQVSIKQGFPERL